MVNEAAGKQEMEDLKERKEGVLERQRERKQSQHDAHAAGLPPGAYGRKSVTHSPATSPKGSPLDSPGIDALVAAKSEKLSGILLLNNCLESSKFNSSGGSASGAGRAAALHILQDAMTNGDEEV